MYRKLLAPNASPMTLQGTQTYIVGQQRLAVIDPGPRADPHLDAISEAIGDGVVLCILLTHLHADHAEAAERMSERTHAPVRSGAHGLRDGDRIGTDAGELVALHTPGHTPEHFSFWWPDRSTVFCGDLMMGGLDTALVAPPEGHVGEYLESLERLRRLAPRVILPAHGPAFQDPLDALARYRKHRLEREAQVLAGLAEQPMNEEQLTQHVYGEQIDPTLWPYARAAVEAYLAHLVEQGRIRRDRDVWTLVRTDGQGQGHGQGTAETRR
jgi:glyoxylase-like metal-dependent hydrolase (beta-lactamase superfamily II)